MKKDQEPQVNLDVKFASISEDLIKLIRKTFKAEIMNSGGVVVRIVSNEWDGGSQALVLDSDGKWSGKMQMMGWDHGKKPSIETLIQEYAEIKDEDYQQLSLGDTEETSERSEKYLVENREILLEKLISEMENKISELKN